MKAFLSKLPLLFLLSISVVVFNCKEEPVVEPPRTFDDVEADFQDIEVVPGKFDIELEVQDGVYYSFRVIFPTADLSQDLPLIFGFHGASGGNPDAHKTTECLIEPGFEAIDAIIIHPNAGTNEWYESVNSQKIANLLYLAFEYWPVDKDKLVFMGYSNGGNASWLYSQQNTFPASAIIPMASSFDLEGKKLDVPAYCIHSNGDELFPIAITRDWVQASIDAGSDITFVEVDELSHYAPCDYVEYLQDAVDWLENDVWVN